jgi:hypothetical protein
VVVVVSVFFSAAGGFAIVSPFSHWPVVHGGIFRRLSGPPRRRFNTLFAGDTPGYDEAGFLVVVGGFNGSFRGAAPVAIQIRLGE